MGGVLFFICIDGALTSQCGGYQQPRIDLRLAPNRQDIVLLNRAVNSGDGGLLAEEEVSVSVGGRDLESNRDLDYGKNGIGTTINVLDRGYMDQCT